MAAGCVPESARISVARVGAAVFRIQRLGARARAGESGPRVVDSARLVHQPELSARSRASLQHADRVRSARPDCGAGAQRPGLPAARRTHEPALHTLRTALAATKTGSAQAER